MYHSCVGEKHQCVGEVPVRKYIYTKYVCIVVCTTTVVCYDDSHFYFGIKISKELFLYTYSMSYTCIALYLITGVLYVWNPEMSEIQIPVSYNYLVKTGH